MEEWGTTLTMMVDRFTYLFQSCARYSGHCLFADFADVWFQRDPFRHLSPRARAADLVLEAEHSSMTIGRFGYNADWVKECWGVGGTVTMFTTAIMTAYRMERQLVRDRKCSTARGDAAFLDRTSERSRILLGLMTQSE